MVDQKHPGRSFVYRDADIAAGLLMLQHMNDWQYRRAMRAKTMRPKMLFKLKSVQLNEKLKLSKELMKPHDQVLEFSGLLVLLKSQVSCRR